MRIDAFDLRQAFRQRQQILVDPQFDLPADLEVRQQEHVQRMADDALGGVFNRDHSEIGIARLEARPTATLCVDCKTLDEIREKQMV